MSNGNGKLAERKLILRVYLVILSMIVASLVFMGVRQIIPPGQFLSYALGIAGTVGALLVKVEPREEPQTVVTESVENVEMTGDNPTVETG